MKIMEQIALIPSHLLALHLQKKYARVACAKADSESEDHGTDSSDPESSPSPPPSKKVCKSSKNKRYHRSVSTKRKYSKSWEKDFSWLYYDEDSEGAFCKICKQSGISDLQHTGGVWVTKPFKNLKKAVEKMKAHSRSDSHSHATQASCTATPEC